MRLWAGRILAVWAILLFFASSLPERAVSEPAQADEERRVKKILEAYQKYCEAFEEIWNGAPPPGDEEERNRHAAQLFHKLWSGLIECNMLFYKPCPEAIVQMILRDGVRAKDMIGALLPPPGPEFNENIRLSLLQVLDENKDPRIQHLIPQFRATVRPLLVSGEDEKFLERYRLAKQLPPKWYIDRAFSEVSYDLSIHNLIAPYQRFYPLVDEALYYFALNDPDFIGGPEDDDNLKEIERTLYVMQAYRLRFEAERLEQRDIDLVRTQLKWLWNTKKWWARRYVVEILAQDPRLAFPNALKELAAEEHPYVAPRITELRLLRELEERLRPISRPD
ncbi:MAG: hypothetical protein RMJ19_06795 [Gemmatales bacterium]|nr:hypothetical protein [Gemmatales bacterium]MDW8175362.1 hypothetical protein [Gemmatales bacterium]